MDIFLDIVVSGCLRGFLFAITRLNEILWTEQPFNVPLLSCIQTECLYSWCCFRRLQQSDGWQMPQAHADIFDWLSLSQLNLWHQSTLYSFISVPPSLPYVGNVCVCAQTLVYNCYFLPSTFIYLCVCVGVRVRVHVRVCVCVITDARRSATCQLLNPAANMEVKESLSV